MQEVIKRLLREPHRFIDIIIATFFMHLMGFAVILYSILVFNTYLPYGVTATLTALTIGCLIGLIIEFYFKGVRTSLASRYYENVVTKIADGFFKKILALKYEEIEKSVKLLRNHAVESIVHLLRPSLTTATTTLLDIPFAFVFLILLFLIHPSLGSIATFFIFISASYAYYSKKQLVQKNYDVNLSERQLVQLFRAINEGAQTNRYTGELNHVQADWSSALKQFFQKGKAAAEVETQINRIPAFIIGVQSVALTAIGATLVFNGQISIGALVGSNLLAAKVLMPVTNLASQLELFNKIDESIRYLREVEQLSEEKEMNTKFKELSGQFAAQEITYRFQHAPSLTFHPISFEIQQCDICAISGRSGSGKSTLLQVLAGLRSPLDGTVYVEGVNLQQISKEWWRSKVSYLPQEPTLTNGTLYQNLLPADNKSAQDELDQVIFDADLTDWFSSLPDGLDYQITDLGRQLSPGIRKKIALARLYLRRSKIYFLDEPSLNLDLEGRKKLTVALNRLHHQGVTLVLVSQDAEFLSGASILINLSNEKGQRVHRKRVFKNVVDLDLANSKPGDIQI